MPSFARCPVCGGIPVLEDGGVSFGRGSKTVFVVHAGQCSFASKVEYLDLASAVSGWNKDVSNFFEKKERAVKKSKSASNPLWGMG